MKKRSNKAILGDSYLHGFYAARQVAFRIRQLARDGVRDRALIEALAAEGYSVPEGDDAGAWSEGLLKVAGEIADAPADLHQELMDAWAWKAEKAKRSGDADPMPWADFADGREKAAWVLGKCNRNIFHNGVGLDLSNAAWCGEGARLVAFGAIARSHAHLDHELADVIGRIADACASKLRGGGRSASLSEDAARELEREYWRGAGQREGYREERGLDFFQAILASWSPERDPYMEIDPLDAGSTDFLVWQTQKKRAGVDVVVAG